jgi:hypothetical protein
MLDQFFLNLQTLSSTLLEDNSFYSIKQNPDLLFILVTVSAALLLALVVSLKSNKRINTTQNEVKKRCNQITTFLNTIQPRILQCERATLNSLGFSAWGIECLLAAKNIIYAVEHRLNEIKSLIQTELALDYIAASELLDKKIKVRHNSLDALIASRDIKDLSIDECPSILSKLLDEVEAEVAAYHAQAKA